MRTTERSGRKAQSGHEPRFEDLVRRFVRVVLGEILPRILLGEGSLKMFERIRVEKIIRVVWFAWWVVWHLPIGRGGAGWRGSFHERGGELPAGMRGAGFLYSEGMALTIPRVTISCLWWIRCPVIYSIRFCGCARESPRNAVLFVTRHTADRTFALNSVLDNPTAMSKVVFGPSFPPAHPLLLSTYPLRQLEMSPTIWARHVSLQIIKPKTATVSHRAHTGSAHRCFQISRSGCRLSVGARSTYEPSVSPWPLILHPIQPRV